MTADAARAAEDQPFEVVGSQHHYHGWVIDVRTDEVRMPDGSTARRDIIAHPGAVAIVALDEHDQVVTVRQYRPAIGTHLVELPAGLLDIDGEPALVAAHRELAEETALAAADWAVLADVYTSPGMTDEAIRIYLARGLSPVTAGEGFVAAGEEITMTVSRIPLDELVRQALAGELTNGPAVVGVLAADRARSLGWAPLRAADSCWSARPGLSG
ncbi:MAG: hydrolase [Pseudonocardiales bacterium]|nr:hydrolase [Pseudonocardiales bacterium]